MDLVYHAWSYYELEDLLKRVVAGPFVFHISKDSNISREVHTSLISYLCKVQVRQ